ncbi:hypothetical protein JTB14_007442 [Gonioctena quinquepunctata]|nr:hypothetical protein JTB14_007442 [Gonioctena quinquepunctata]
MIAVDGNSSKDTDNTPPRGKILKKNYKHKYRREWQDTLPWIDKSLKGCNYFLCKVCGKDLQGGLVAAKKHGTTAVHKTKSSAVAHHQRPITEMLRNNTTLENKTKELEIRASMFIVEHNIAFNSVDHLTNLLKEAANHPEAVKGMTLKRTKCTAVVKNVTG